MNSQSTHLTAARKADHIRINLEEDVRSGVTSGLENYTFLHEAIPDFDLSAVDASQSIFKRLVQFPILISSMTGGTEDAGRINQILAETAQLRGIAMGVGSQRAAIENPALAKTFQIRRYAPDILLFANLGAIQLKKGYGLGECRRAVEMIEADALILHFNALQEALQPEGDTEFSGLLSAVEEICAGVGVPVIAKEVGWGFSGSTAARLMDAGVSAIDVAGAGGTSWSQVEMYREKDPVRANVAAAFRSWGIPTAQSIRMVHQAAPNLFIFASGGVRDGLDIAISIALGASLGGMAGPFLSAAAQSGEAVLNLVDELAQTIRIAMFAAGARTIPELKNTPLLYKEGRQAWH